MRILFIFIDGLGIGENDPEKNPVYAAKTPAFDRLFSEGLVMLTDPLLGVPGLPQSATGQTTIFTGVNASKVVGRHINAQPTKELRDMIWQDNLFKMLARDGFKATNSNVYRQEYIDLMHDIKQKRYKPSVTSVMTMSSGIPFRLEEDYIQGRGLYHDITGQSISDSGCDIGIITPQEAAERYYSVAQDYDFTLFEYFITDIVGHKMDMDLGIKTIELLDVFLGSVMELLVPKEDILFITSDHGNIEDLSVKTHTKNPVPTILYGKLPEAFNASVCSLTDITPVVLKLLKAGNR